MFKKVSFDFAKFTCLWTLTYFTYNLEYHYLYYYIISIVLYEGILTKTISSFMLISKLVGFILYYICNGHLVTIFITECNELLFDNILCYKTIEYLKKKSIVLYYIAKHESTFFIHFFVQYLLLYLLFDTLLLIDTLTTPNTLTVIVLILVVLLFIISRYRYFLLLQCIQLVSSNLNIIHSVQSFIVLALGFLFYNLKTYPKNIIQLQYVNEYPYQQNTKNIDPNFNKIHQNIMKTPIDDHIVDPLLDPIREDIQKNIQLEIINTKKMLYPKTVSNQGCGIQLTDIQELDIMEESYWSINNTKC
jgi:hypothetical protein